MNQSDGAPACAPPLIIRPILFEAFDWLECGMTTVAATEPGEDRIALAARMPEALGLERFGVAVGEQTHGEEIATIGWRDGQTPPPEPDEVSEIPGVDGFLTEEQNVLVGVFTADCVPVTVVDPIRHAMAVVHAGRAGTLRAIARRAVDLMVEAGSVPGDLYAWIGPSVSATRYEVSEEIAMDFRDHFGHFPGAVQGPENRQLALGVVNWCQLIARGLAMERIELDARCTFERADLFHSYRRDGDQAGRMFTFAAIRL